MLWFKIHYPIFTSLFCLFQESQKHRGGGTVCTNHEALWLAFIDAVAAREACPDYRDNIKKDHKLLSDKKIG
jgi:hypothetical protein